MCIYYGRIIMKKIYISVLFLLVGCIVTNVQSVGNKNVSQGVGTKHYEDQLADNDITIQDYLYDLELRINKPGWQITAKELKTMRMANDNRYDSIQWQIQDLLQQYRARNINLSTFQNKVKEAIRAAFTS